MNPEDLRKGAQESTPANKHPEGHPISFASLTRGHMLLLLLTMSKDTLTGCNA